MYRHLTMIEQPWVKYINMDAGDCQKECLLRFRAVLVA